MEDEARVAQHVATRAMALARSGADPEAAARVLVGFARGGARALELARARCAAAVDQHPGDRAAARAMALLDRARELLSE